MVKSSAITSAVGVALVAHATLGGGSVIELVVQHLEPMPPSVYKYVASATPLAPALDSGAVIGAEFAGNPNTGELFGVLLRETDGSIDILRAESGDTTVIPGRLFARDGKVVHALQDVFTPNPARTLELYSDGASTRFVDIGDANSDGVVDVVDISYVLFRLGGC